MSWGENEPVRASPVVRRLSLLWNAPPGAPYIVVPRGQGVAHMPNFTIWVTGEQCFPISKSVVPQCIVLFLQPMSCIVVVLVVLGLVIVPILLSWSLMPGPSCERAKTCQLYHSHIDSTVATLPVSACSSSFLSSCPGH